LRSFKILTFIQPVYVFHVFVLARQISASRRVFVMRFAPFIRQRHHITYLFQLRRPPADAKPCAFIKTVPNPSEKTGQLYCGRQCRKQKGATPAQPGADKTASRMVSCAAQGERPTLAGAGGEQSLFKQRPSA